MEDITSSAKAKGPYIRVIVIALGALLTTCVTLSLLHIMYTKYCKRRYQTTPTNLFARGPITFGLDKHLLNSIPILFYSATTSDLNHINPDNDQCVICLGFFIKGDLIRCLPICGHIFHVSCIDDWFHAHSSCPICRSLVRMSDDNSRTQMGVSGCGGITRSRSGDLLCHCDKTVMPIKGSRSIDLERGALTRSLSMDQISVAIDTKEDMGAPCPSSSSSYTSCPPLSKIDFILSRLSQASSSRHLERLAPRALNDLRQGGVTLRDSGVLPY